ncbi:MAG: type IV pili methyl-accepting chemotaxis transducer N-terminal domain-containing protein [Anaerolineae bacterium]
MPDSLRGRFTLLFVAFVLLVLVSVGATYIGLETQRQDALIINLAGRQRMLIQQMGRLAFEAGAGQDTVNAALQESEKMFTQTLQALRDGGAGPLPAFWRGHHSAQAGPEAGHGPGSGFFCLE